MLSATMEPDQTIETSPAKSALEEIESLRTLLRATMLAYTTRLDTELDTIRDRVAGLGAADDLTTPKLRDLRDMLTLLRHVDVKPEKARRKDVKKIDSVISDLTLIVEGW